MEVDDQGGSYYVMQFVRGKTLKETIGEFFSTQQTPPVDRSEAAKQLGQAPRNDSNLLENSHVRSEPVPFFRNLPANETNQNEPKEIEFHRLIERF